MTTFDGGMQVRYITTSTQDVDDIRKLGNGWIRVTIDVSVVAAAGNTGNPLAGIDWTMGTGEAAINHAHSIGLKVLACIAYQPSWMGTYHQIPQDATHRGYWNAVFAAAITHYGANVDAWEIWNEPNHDPFNSTPDMATIRPFMRSAILAARAVNPSVVLMCGGCASASSRTAQLDAKWDAGTTASGSSISPATYLDRLYDTGGIDAGTSGAWVNAVAIHGYTGTFNPTGPLDVDGRLPRSRFENPLAHAFIKMTGVGDYTVFGGADQSHSVGFSYYDDIVQVRDSGKPIWQTEGGFYGGYPTLTEGDANNDLIIALAFWQAQQVAGKAGPYFYFELHDNKITYLDGSKETGNSEDYLGMYRKQEIVGGGTAWVAKAQLAAWLAFNIEQATYGVSFYGVDAYASNVAPPPVVGDMPIDAGGGRTLTLADLFQTDGLLGSYGQVSGSTVPPALTLLLDKDIYAPDEAITATYIADGVVTTVTFTAPNQGITDFAATGDPHVWTGVAAPTIFPPPPPIVDGQVATMQEAFLQIPTLRPDAPILGVPSDGGIGSPGGYIGGTGGGLDPGQCYLVCQVFNPMPPGARYGTAFYGTDVYAGAGIWQDVSNRVRSLSWQRGCESPLDRPRIGTATVVLANIDGQASAYAVGGDFGQIIGDNQAGPTFLRPGAFVRFGALTDDGWEPWYTGFVDAISETTPNNVDGEVQLNLLELSALLSRLDRDALPLPVGSNDTLDERINRLLDDADWPAHYSVMADTVGDLVAFISTSMAQNRWGDVLLAGDTVGMRVLTAPNGTLTVTPPYPDATSHSEVLFSNVVDGAEVPVASAVPRSSTDRIVNQAVAARVGGTEQTVNDPASIRAYGVIDPGGKRDDLICTTDAAVVRMLSRLVDDAKDDYIGVESITLDADMDVRLPALMSFYASAGLEARPVFNLRLVHPSGTHQDFELVLEGLKFSLVAIAPGVAPKFTATISTATRILRSNLAVYGSSSYGVDYYATTIH